VHACAVLGDGTVQCWGSNSYGSLGAGLDNVSVYELTPIAVTGISNATSITTGGQYGPNIDDDMGTSCALLSDGTIKCWGSDYHGQLGSGARNTATIKLRYSSSPQTVYYSKTPVEVTGISNASAVSTSKFWNSHTCAIVDQGSVKCWGANWEGQLGSGSTHNCGNSSNDCSATPVSVDGITSATAISAGGSHTCALLADKTIKCWGYDNDGQLGSGYINTYSYTSGSNTYSRNGSRTPVSVTGINNAIAVSAGESHTCALLEDKTVKCWGRNQNGQFGDGLGASSSTPVTTLF